MLLGAFDFSVSVDPLSQKVGQLYVSLGAVLVKFNVDLGDDAGEVFSRDRKYEAVRGRGGDCVAVASVVDRVRLPKDRPSAEIAKLYL